MADPRVPGHVFVGLTLDTTKPSYFVLSGDILDAGEPVYATLSFPAGLSADCDDVKYYKGAQEYLIMKWPGKTPAWGPGTGDVNVTITVKKKSDDGVIVRRKVAMMIVDTGEIP